MKHLCLLACVALTSCQVAPVRTLGPARLEIAPASSARSSGHIYSVDGHPTPDGPLLVAPGVLKLEYVCPGWATVDGYPSFTALLRSGRTYEFYCSEGEPHVREVVPRAGD